MDDRAIVQCFRYWLVSIRRACGALNFDRSTYPLAPALRSATGTLPDEVPKPNPDEHTSRCSIFVAKYNKFDHCNATIPITVLPW